MKLFLRLTILLRKTEKLEDRSLLERFILICLKKLCGEKYRRALRTNVVKENGKKKALASVQNAVRAQTKNVGHLCKLVELSSRTDMYDNVTRFIYSLIVKQYGLDAKENDINQHRQGLARLSIKIFGNELYRLTVRKGDGGN